MRSDAVCLDAYQGWSPSDATAMAQRSTAISTDLMRTQLPSQAHRSVVSGIAMPPALRHTYGSRSQLCVPTATSLVRAASSVAASSLPRTWRRLNRGLAPLRVASRHQSPRQLKTSRVLAAEQPEPVEGCPYDVFLSHAGGEDPVVKKLLGFLRRELNRLPYVKDRPIAAFLDEADMRQLGKNRKIISEALLSAPLGVVVIDDAFMASEWTMWELGIMMRAYRKGLASVEEQQQQPGPERSLLPVFLLDIDKVQDTYQKHWGNPDRRADCKLPVATPDDIKELCTFIGIRQDQHNVKRPDQLLDEAFARIVAELKGSGRVPQGCTAGQALVRVDSSSHSLQVALTIRRETRQLVGRHNEVSRVLNSVRHSGAAVIWGGPGEGKTTIAKEVACRLQEDGTLQLCVAINMEGIRGLSTAGSTPVNTLEAATKSCHQHMAPLLTPHHNKLQAQQISDSEGAWGSIERWLANLGESALLCFENADVPLCSKQLAQGFRALVQHLQELGVRVLVTSRCAFGVLLGRDALQLRLPSLAEGDAVALLRTEVNGEACAVTDQDATTLVLICHCNALAIIIIRGFILKELVTAQEAVADATKAGVRGIAPPEGDSDSGSSAAEELDSPVRRVTAFWLRQYLSSPQLEATAKLSLFGASFNAAGAAAVISPAAGADPPATDSAVMLRSLRGLSILQHLTTAERLPAEQSRYYMHVLIRDLARQFKTEQPADQRLSAVRGFVQYMISRGLELDQLQPAADTLAAEHLTLETANYQAMVQLASGPLCSGLLEESEEMRRGLFTLGCALAKWDEPTLALEVGQVDLRSRQRWPDHSDTLDSMAFVSIQLALVGQAQEALDLALHVLTLGQRLVGPTHPRVLVIVANLVHQLAELGYIEMAVHMSQVLLNMQRDVLRPEDPTRGMTLLNLSSHLATLGHAERAVETARQAVTELQRVLGPKDLTTLVSMHQLSRLLADLGQHAAAADLAWQVLALHQRVAGPEHRRTLSSMIRLSNRLSELGQREEAADMAKRALVVQQRKLGHNHRDVVRSMEVLSYHLANLGQHEAALDMGRQLLAVLQRSVGHEHPSTLRSMSNVGTNLYQVGQLEEAADIVKQALEAQQRVLERDHPDTLKSMHRLGMILSELGQQSAAVDIAMQALEAQQRVLGPDHTDTLRSMFVLTIHFRSLERHAEAVNLAWQLLLAQHRLLGHEHISTKANMANVVMCSVRYLSDTIFTAYKRQL